MGWKRRSEPFISACRILLLLIWSGVSCGSLLAQEVWSDEDIRQARDGIKYEGQPQPDVKETTKSLSTSDFEPMPLEDPPSPFWEAVTNFFQSPGGKISTFILILSLLVFTILKFIQRNKQVADIKVVMISPEELLELEDNLVETDLEKFLRHALETKNYKLAVRIHYLMVLQNLHEAELIIWRKEKTNNDYVREMSRHVGFGQIRDLTFAFEVVWYADTEINESTYHRVSPAFLHYQNLILVKKKDQ